MKTFPIELPDNLWMALKRMALDKEISLKQLVLDILDSAQQNHIQHESNAVTRAK